jgi:hypothetical protein
VRFAASAEDIMQRHSETVTFVAVLAVSAALGLILSAGRVAAADRVPGPEATSGGSGSTSSRVNYDANYHADYRVNKSANDAKDTEDARARREGQREIQRDWSKAPGMDPYGRTPWGSPR